MDEHTEPHWDHCALVTIDMQGDFATGAMPVRGTEEIIPALRSLTKAFRAASAPIYHAVRLYLPDGSNADLIRRGPISAGAKVVLPGTPGSELVEGLLEQPSVLNPDRLLARELQQVGPSEFVVYKPRWNAFFGTALEGELQRRAVDTVVIAGCNYPYCPRGTGFGASERDLRAVMAADAISGFNKSSAAEMDRIGVQAMTVGAIAKALRSQPTAPGRPPREPSTEHGGATSVGEKRH